MIEHPAGAEKSKEENKQEPFLREQSSNIIEISAKGKRIMQLHLPLFYSNTA
jgi:hypothetical protein